MRYKTQLGTLPETQHEIFFSFLVHKTALKFYLQKIVKLNQSEITKDNKSLSRGQKISSR